MRDAARGADGQQLPPSAATPGARRLE